MQKFLLFVFLFSTLLFSCENNLDKKEKLDSNLPDPFRENVLKLRRLGLLNSISDKNLDSLIGVYKKDSLNGLKNLLVKSGELLQLDLKLNGKDPLEIYRKICGEVGKKFPDLKNDSLMCNYIPNKPNGNDTGWVIMRQRIGNEVYVQKLYYLKDEKMDETFCKIYNKRLAAEKKKYRIYLVTFICTNCYNPFDDSKVKEDIGTTGIIALTKTQADSLVPMDELALDPDDEFATFTPTEVETKIKQFEATGILLKSDSAWWNYQKNNMRMSNIYGMEDFYNFLDTLFCTASFDTLNDYNPYQDVILRMQKISRGKFNPSDVRDEKQDETTHHVSFDLGNKKYERDAEEKGGILCPGIIDDVNKALEEQKVGGQFYTVLSRDNVLLLIYLDDKTAEKAKASGFFTEFEKGVPPELSGKYANATNQ